MSPATGSGVEASKIRVAVPTRGTVNYLTAQRLQEIRDANPGLPPVMYEAGRLGVSNVRNTIAKKFLLDADVPDWLIMVDDDLVPPPSLLDLTSDDTADIVAYPYLIVRPGISLPFPCAFRWDAEKGVHTVIDQPFSQTGRISCDAAGTGCMAVHRRVLTALKAPFDMQSDEDGIMLRSDDMAFCMKARDAGFSVTVDFTKLADHQPAGTSLNMLHVMYSQAYQAARAREASRPRIVIPGSA